MARENKYEKKQEKRRIPLQYRDSSKDSVNNRQKSSKSNDTFRPIAQTGNSESSSKIKKIKTKPQIRRQAPIHREPEPELRVIKGGQAQKKLRRILTVSAAMGLIFVVIFANQKAPGGLLEWSLSYSAGLGKGDEFPVSAANGLKNGFMETDGCVYLLSDAVFTAFNSSGYKIFGRSHGYADPALGLSRSRAIIFDRGGTSFRLDNKNRMLYEGKLKNSIITAAVGDSGNFAVASRSDGYMSEIKVYSKKFQVEYTRYIANHLVSALAVSPNGKHISAAVYGAERGAPVSILYGLDDKNQPRFEHKFTDEILFYLSYDRVSGNIITLSDKALRIFSESGKKISEFTENGYKSAIISVDNHAALMTLEGTTENRVIFWDSSGKSPKSFALSGDFRSIACDKSYIYLLDSEGLKKFDHSGKLIDTAETSLYAQNILKSGDGIYFSDLAGIDFVEFSKDS